MSELLAKNALMASKLKDTIKLRYEPVAVKLIKKGETFPEGYNTPEKQLSHCQAVFAAKNGEKLSMPLEMQGCMVGAATLGMTEKAEKVKNGEFHAGMGIHESPASAANMISMVTDIDYETVGEIVCPLKDANFEPDVVIFVDIPERIYWVECMHTYTSGGRVSYLTAPFQCACADITAYPMMKGVPNISIGCFGCRKKTDMKADEMAMGVPYSDIVKNIDVMDKYAEGVMTKAKRD